MQHRGQNPPYPCTLQFPTAWSHHNGVTLRIINADKLIIAFGVFDSSLLAGVLSATHDQTYLICNYGSVCSCIAIQLLIPVYLRHSVHVIIKMCVQALPSTYLYASLAWSLRSVCLCTGFSIMERACYIVRRQTTIRYHVLCSFVVCYYVFKHMLLLIWPVSCSNYNTFTCGKQYRNRPSYCMLSHGAPCARPKQSDAWRSMLACVCKCRKIRHNMFM